MFVFDGYTYFKGGFKGMEFFKSNNHGVYHIYKEEYLEKRKQWLDKIKEMCGWKGGASDA